MSLEAAMKKIRRQYQIYKRVLDASDPSVEDQLVDAELRGMVKAFEIMFNIFRGESNGEDERFN